MKRLTKKPSLGADIRPLTCGKSADLTPANRHRPGTHSAKRCSPQRFDRTSKAGSVEARLLTHPASADHLHRDGTVLDEPLSNRQRMGLRDATHLQRAFGKDLARCT